MSAEALMHVVGVLLGGLGGGLLRLLPELLSLWNAYQKRRQDAADKAHELEVMKLQIEAQKMAGALRLEEIQAEGAMDAVLAQIRGTLALAQPTGHRGVDVLNASVRPVVTYWFFGLYAAVKTAGLYAAIAAVAPPTADAVTRALERTWLAEDSATLFGILSFWFLGRVIDKRAGR
jgi:hypothetical protein